MSLYPVSGEPEHVCQGCGGDRCNCEEEMEEMTERQKDAALMVEMLAACDKALDALDQGASLGGVANKTRLSRVMTAAFKALDKEAQEELGWWNSTAERGEYIRRCKDADNEERCERYTTNVPTFMDKPMCETCTCKFEAAIHKHAPAA